jgi:hypothetical protein
VLGLPRLIAAPEKQKEEATASLIKITEQHYYHQKNTRATLLSQKKSFHASTMSNGNINLARVIVAVLLLAVPSFAFLTPKFPSPRSASNSELWSFTRKEPFRSEEESEYDAAMRDERSLKMSEKLEKVYFVSRDKKTAPHDNSNATKLERVAQSVTSLDRDLLWSYEPFNSTNSSFLPIPAENYDGYVSLKCFHLPQRSSTLISPLSFESIRRNSYSGIYLREVSPTTGTSVFITRHDLYRGQDIYDYLHRNLPYTPDPIPSRRPEKHKNVTGLPLDPILDPRSDEQSDEPEGPQEHPFFPKAALLQMTSITAVSICCIWALPKFTLHRTARKKKVTENTFHGTTVFVVFPKWWDDGTPFTLTPHLVLLQSYQPYQVTDPYAPRFKLADGTIHTAAGKGILRVYETDIDCFYVPELTTTLISHKKYITKLYGQTYMCTLSPLSVPLPFIFSPSTVPPHVPIVETVPTHEPPKVPNQGAEDLFPNWTIS